MGSGGGDIWGRRGQRWTWEGGESNKRLGVGWEKCGESREIEVEEEKGNMRG